MQTLRIVVVGAGMGGLVAGLLLAAKGCAVTVLDMGVGPGGKMCPLTVDGVAVDGGPTVFTMRWVFQSIFDDLGLDFDAHVPLEPLGTIARHAWEDGARLDLFADIARNADEIARFAGLREREGYLSFCRRSAQIFETLRDTFITATRPDPLTLARRIGMGHVGDLMSISPFATLWAELGRHFQNPRLRQLFGRYATYCGASPFAAPATLMLIAHVEQQGVWRITGGMRRLAATLDELLRARGGTLRYATRVSRILVERGRASGVELESGERIPADAVVFNGDAEALATGLLGREAQRALKAGSPANRSLSAITWTMLAQTDGFPLAHHNVFFNDDYAAEFGDIFNAGRLPRHPTVYVCAQDRGDEMGEHAERGTERLLCLVNAPAKGDDASRNRMGVETCETDTFRFLDRCGLKIQQTQDASLRRTPAEFANLFPGTGGALYGRASHGWMASFMRPGARTKVPGLYLAGGSTHPGPGVPMAALSGRLAASSLVSDLSSTGRLAPAAIHGGTSMRWTTKGGAG